jgi:molecular chaperone DnaK
MVKDAEKFADQDRKRKVEIEAHNRADSAHYQVQKFVQENQEKLDEADKKSLQEAMDALKSALDRNADASELEKLHDALMDAWQKVGAKMHQASQASQPPPSAGAAGSGGGPSDGEDVVDGEYRKV